MGMKRKVRITRGRLTTQIYSNLLTFAGTPDFTGCSFQAGSSG